MSLVRFAIRISAVEAVKGRTLVGDNVLDSEIGAISVGADGSAQTEKENPFLAIYTDKGKVELSLSNGREVFENGTCELIFEAGVTAAMNEIDPETGASVLVGIPDTDAAREYYLDLTSRQILTALTDPKNEWGQIFLGFIPEIKAIDINRAGNTDGVRFAAHQIKLLCELICDPVKGDSLSEGDIFYDFLAKLEASGNDVYLKYAQDIRAELNGDLQDWEVLQQRLGLRSGELLSVGHGLTVSDDTPEAPELTTATISMDGRPDTEVS